MGEGKVAYANDFQGIPAHPNFAELTFLGTGTSCGVPVVGCSCATCTSRDPRDRRLRCSATLAFPTRGGLRVLIDAGPDLRAQALAHGFSAFAGCVLTHSHSDHIGGMSDLREFNGYGAATVYATDATLAGVRRMFGYIWDPHTAVGGGLPAVTLAPVRHFAPFVVRDPADPDPRHAVTVTSFPVLHGAMEISGYVFEWIPDDDHQQEEQQEGQEQEEKKEEKLIRGLVYITDASELPDESRTFLTTVRPQVLVVNALRYVPHPTHWDVDHAVALAAAVRPTLGTYLVHMNDFCRHCELAALLPPGIQPAFDGLSILLPLSDGAVASDASSSSSS